MVVQLFTEIVSYADFTTVLLFLVIAYLTWKISTGYNLPPGPIGLPILGYLPFMGSGPVEETFYKLSKKYGPVMSIQLGSTFTVILNDFEVIKEALVKQGDNFAGRPLGDALKITEDDVGLFTSDGEPWREHRRFIMSSMRDYGMGKMSLEPKIMEEIHAFLDVLAKQKGVPYDITDILGMSTSNIISALEFGKRFEYSDARYIRLRKMQDEIMELFNSVSARTLFPWIKYLPFSDRITKLSRMIEINEDMKQFIRDQVEEHRADYHENSKSDLIDAYFVERNAAIKKMGHEGTFNDLEMVSTLQALFSAGTETTTSTMRWAILYLMAYPEIQKKVQKEIDDVVGMERDPTMSDKSKLVYTEAVLLEIQRIGSLAPLSAPHSNIEEAELCGYRIPKRSFILTNIWVVHYDPKLWKEPEKFNPERFINKQGRIDRPEYLIPFGIGKRMCAGEALARMEIFLYFTSMLQRFTFQPPNGKSVSLAFESTAVRRPKPYEMCAIQRPGYSVK